MKAVLSQKTWNADRSFISALLRERVAIHGLDELESHNAGTQQLGKL